MIKTRYYVISELMIILLCIGIYYTIPEYEEIQVEHEITMKWKEPKLLTTHYYFELDGEIEYNVDSYEWYKYNIGDKFNITEYVKT